MGLRAKFNLVMLAAFAVGFIVAAAVLYRVVSTNARDQVLQSARIMMTGADAIRSYTANYLQPLLPTEHAGKFVAETVPAFAAQKNFKILQDRFSGYSYREAALNPTNLVDRAYDWEADIIRSFRDDPTREEVITERDTPTGQLLHLARPIRIRSEACLTCHSTAERAPPALTRTYGTVNGFGWTMNEIIGAQILSVPMALPFELAQKSYMTSLVIIVLVFGVIFAVVNLLMHFLVLGPIKQVSAVADAVSMGAEDVEVYVKPGKDEISSLSVSFNRMRESLKHAMDMIR
jgi:protein-histidine pros-kinase